MAPYGSCSPNVFYLECRGLGISSCGLKLTLCMWQSDNLINICYCNLGGNVSRIFSCTVPSIIISSSLSSINLRWTKFSWWLSLVLREGMWDALSDIVLTWLGGSWLLQVPESLSALIFVGVKKTLMHLSAEQCHLPEYCSCLIIVVKEALECTYLY